MINLEPIAEKLGVAVEHLWEVLIRQAPISGVFDLLFYALTGAAAYATYKLWLFIIRKCGEDRWDEIAYLWPGLATISVAAMIIASLASMSTTAAAFFNPEYWALHQVLSAIGEK